MAKVNNSGNRDAGFFYCIRDSNHTSCAYGNWTIRLGGCSILSGKALKNKSKKITLLTELLRSLLNDPLYLKQHVSKG